MSIQHANLNSIHKFAYVQELDPGAIGAYKGWVDTSSSPYILRVRNSTNTGWDEVGSSIGGGSGGDLTTLADYDGTLSGAVAEIGTTDKVILSVVTPITVASNLTVPANIHLDIRSTITMGA